MKIYISGKISGLPIEEAIASFQAAEDYLLEKYKSHGIQVVNPFKLEHLKAKTLEGIYRLEQIADPEVERKVSERDIWNAYMKEDIGALLECNYIFMLKDWGTSKGARTEYAIAKELNLVISYQDESDNLSGARPAGA